MQQNRVRLTGCSLSYVYVNVNNVDAKHWPTLPAANSQYPFEAQQAGTVQEIAPGLMWVRMPLPFALDHINLWLVADGRALDHGRLRSCDEHDAGALG